MSTTKPLVSVSCIAYNHEKYIEKCIKSIISQKTNFKIELLVYDDASTDKTPEIIKKYAEKHPEIIFPMLQKENQFSKGGIRIMERYNFSRANGKYIAICDGDDYWTDPYKLQKQVDFLESHPGYMVCGTRAKRVDENGKEYPDLSKISGEVSLNDIVKKNQFSASTTVFYAENYKEQLFDNYSDFKIGDWPLWCSLLQYGKGYNMKEVTAQYNIHSGGMVSGRNLSKTLEQKLSDRILLMDNIPAKKNIIKKYGLRIIMHYIKKALRLQPGYGKALNKNKKLIIRFLTK